MFNSDFFLPRQSLRDFEVTNDGNSSPSSPSCLSLYLNLTTQLNHGVCTMSTVQCHNNDAELLTEMKQR